MSDYRVRAERLRDEGVWVHAAGIPFAPIYVGLKYRGKTANDPVYKKPEFTHTRPPSTPIPT